MSKQDPARDNKLWAQAMVRVGLLFVLGLCVAEQGCKSRKIPEMHVGVNKDVYLGSLDISSANTEHVFSLDIPQDQGKLYRLLLVGDGDIVGAESVADGPPSRFNPAVLEVMVQNGTDVPVASWENTVAVMKETNWFSPNWSVVLNPDFQTLDQFVVPGREYRLILRVKKTCDPPGRCLVYLSYVAPARVRLP